MSQHVILVEFAIFLVVTAGAGGHAGGTADGFLKMMYRFRSPVDTGSTPDSNAVRVSIIQ